MTPAERAAYRRGFLDSQRTVAESMRNQAARYLRVGNFRASELAGGFSVAIDNVADQIESGALELEPREPTT